MSRGNGQDNQTEQLVEKVRKLEPYLKMLEEKTASLPNDDPLSVIGDALRLFLIAHTDHINYTGLVYGRILGLEQSIKAGVWKIIAAIGGATLSLLTGLVLYWINNL